MAKRTEVLKTMLRRKSKSECDGVLLSSGSSLLNLACTGRVEGAFLPGTYVFYVGDSVSGKTFVALTSLAEAANNRAFDKYDLIYDPVERGALMDFGKFFGEKMAGRIQPPPNGRSDTVEQFYDNLHAATKRPCIYVLDSQDALSSEAEQKKAGKQRRARSEGEQSAGSYGDSKAKVHSANIRRALKPLEKTGSILLMLNQTRDSFSLFERSSASGGRALKFYATIQLWSSSAGNIERQVRGKKRQLGITCKVRVKKTRITGRDRTVLVPIFHSCGVDDVLGCVQYLVGEREWKSKDGENGKLIRATGLGPEHVGTEEQIVRWIEESDKEADLRELVEQTWQDIERACEVARKRRYE